MTKGKSTQQKTAMAVQLFDEAAEAYQERHMDVKAYAASLDLFSEKLNPKNAKVLELACGPGNITQYLLQKQPDLCILATDLAPQMLELARKNVPNVRFELLDCKDIAKTKDTYNGIVCGFGFPYLSKSEALQFIADAAQKLHTKGLIYISTMEDPYENSKWVGTKEGEPGQLYMHYHEADYLIAALGQHGLKLLHVGFVPLPIPDGNIQDLVLVAEKME